MKVPTERGSALRSRAQVREELHLPANLPGPETVRTAAEQLQLPGDGAADDTPLSSPRVRAVADAIVTQAAAGENRPGPCGHSARSYAVPTSIAFSMIVRCKRACLVRGKVMA